MSSGFLSKLFGLSKNRESQKNFVVKVEGINSKDLVRIDGPGGTFFVKRIGSREELPGGFFYGDENCQFFLYGKWKENSDGTFSIDVYEATTQRLSGGKPHISLKNINIVKRNIEFLYLNRDFNFPEKPPMSNDVISLVTFNWGLE